MLNDFANDNRRDTAFVIETAEATAGVIVRQESGFRFFAADPRFGPLDGSTFKSPRAAQKAADLMQKVVARDHAAARRFGAAWSGRDGRPAAASSAPRSGTA
jgi:hypothetical protein